MANHQPGHERRVSAERLGDPEPLVPLGHALGAGEGADLQHLRPPADGKVRHRHVLGLARASRDDVCQPAARAASKAALVSVSVPAWLGLISAVLQAPTSAAWRTRAGIGDEVIVADDADALRRLA